jgi:hypothetical protein
MIKELKDIVDLIGQCPEHVQRNAAQALSTELQQHEDWISCGRPDRQTWLKIRVERAANRSNDHWPPKNRWSGVN